MLELLRRSGELLVSQAQPASRAKAERDAAILGANCAEQVLSTLSPYVSFVPKSNEAMQRLLDERVEALVEADSAELLVESHLDGALKGVASVPAPSLAAARPHLQHFLTTFLSSSSSLLSGPAFLSRLFSPTLRAAVHKRGMQRLVETYATVLRSVEEQVRAESGSEPAGDANGTTWEALRGTMRSVDEVRMLLGVDGDVGQDAA